MLVKNTNECRNRNWASYRNAGDLHLALRSDRSLPDGHATGWRQLRTAPGSTTVGRCIDDSDSTDAAYHGDAGCVECGGSGHDDSGDRDWRRNGILSAACLRRDRARRAGDRYEYGSWFRSFSGQGAWRKRSGSGPIVPDALDADFFWHWTVISR